MRTISKAHYLAAAGKTIEQFDALRRRDQMPYFAVKPKDRKRDEYFAIEAIMMDLSDSLCARIDRSVVAQILTGSPELFMESVHHPSHSFDEDLWYAIRPKSDETYYWPDIACWAQLPEKLGNPSSIVAANLSQAVRNVRQRSIEAGFSIEPDMLPWIGDVSSIS